MQSLYPCPSPSQRYWRVTMQGGYQHGRHGLVVENSKSQGNVFIPPVSQYLEKSGNLMWT